MVRTITVAREYGSGGARIGGLLAQRLGWRLLDRALIGEIARAARVDPAIAEAYDERVDSWLHRLMRHAFWRGAFEAVTIATEADFFDGESMAALARPVIEEAAVIGNCVIIGRGGQCILQEREDVFHVFIYAPWRERVDQARNRLPADVDVEVTIREMDRQRTAFIQRYFQQDRMNPHLYDLMISSTLGEEVVISVILSAVRVAAAGAGSAGSR